MIIIWRGLGFLVVVSVFGLSLLANYLANQFTGSKQYWQEHGWPFAVSLLAAGAVCWLLGSARDGSLESAANQNVPARDTFFFIRLRWWGPILIALAIAYIASGQTPGQPHSLR